MMLENGRAWKQDYLYRMFSHHTKDKEKENYVVNTIWARLDDLNIKPVTQQYVRRPNGYALIDLSLFMVESGRASMCMLAHLICCAILMLYGIAGFCP